MEVLWLQEFYSCLCSTMKLRVLSIALHSRSSDLKFTLLSQAGRAISLSSHFHASN